jgi:hypothetical protein
LEKASKTYIGDDLHSFCSPLTKRPWDSHRVVPESLVNIAHLPKLNKSSGFAHDCRVGWDRGITIIDRAPFRRYIHRGKNMVATASGDPGRLATYIPACHDVRQFWQAAGDGAVTKDESTGQ